jgi:hypothetical protein
MADSSPTATDASIPSGLIQFHRLGWLRRLRPQILATHLAKILRTQERFITSTSWGLELYLDPLSSLGSAFFQTGDYEPDTRSIMNTALKPGDTFVDIGANEGVFSCLAGSVIAVEPQSRLEIFCA